MKQIVVIICAVLLSCCNTEPPEINFGKDLCEFCKMTIMDRKFGAELINSKGKGLKFDSQECMVNYLKRNTEFNPEKYLVINYGEPGNLIDAQKAFYLHGGEVKSPMGGQLAAFESQESIQEFRKKLKGDVILWPELIDFNF